MGRRFDSEKGVFRLQEERPAVGVGVAGIPAYLVASTARTEREGRWLVGQVGDTERDAQRVVQHAVLNQVLHGRVGIHVQLHELGRTARRAVRQYR